MSDRRRSKNTLQRATIKTLIRNCNADKDEWTIFAKHFRSEFVEFHYNSVLNKKGSNGIKLFCPQHFRDRIKDLTNIDVVNAKLIKARQSRSSYDPICKG